MGQLHNIYNTARAVSSDNCVRNNIVECSKGIKRERECATSNKQPKHTLFHLTSIIAMDYFATIAAHIFASSVSEETPSQIDFENKGGCGNGYCVIA